MDTPLAATSSPAPSDSDGLFEDELEFVPQELLSGPGAEGSNEAAGQAEYTSSVPAAAASTTNGAPASNAPAPSMNPAGTTSEQPRAIAPAPAAPPPVARPAADLVAAGPGAPGTPLAPQAPPAHASLQGVLPQQSVTNTPPVPPAEAPSSTVPVKRGPGRPRKNPLSEGAPSSRASSAAPGSAPKKRGRPRGSTTKAKRKKKDDSSEDEDVNGDTSDEDKEETKRKVLNPGEEWPDDYDPAQAVPTTKFGRKVHKPAAFVPMAQPQLSRPRKPRPPSVAPSSSLVHPHANLTCSVCKAGHSPHHNRIVLCDGCNDGYHQVCAVPNVDEKIIEDDLSWFCAKCDAKREKFETNVERGRWVDSRGGVPPGLYPYGGTNGMGREPYSDDQKREWIGLLPLSNVQEYILSLERKYARALRGPEQAHYGLEIWPDNLPDVLKRAKDKREEDARRREEKEAAEALAASVKVERDGDALMNTSTSSSTQPSNEDGWVNFAKGEKARTVASQRSQPYSSHVPTSLPATLAPLSSISTASASTGMGRTVYSEPSVGGTGSALNSPNSSYASPTFPQVGRPPSQPSSIQPPMGRSVSRASIGSAGTAAAHFSTPFNPTPALTPAASGPGGQNGVSAASQIPSLYSHHQQQQPQARQSPNLGQSVGYGGASSNSYYGSSSNNYSQSGLSQSQSAYYPPHQQHYGQPGSYGGSAGAPQLPPIQSLQPGSSSSAGSMYNAQQSYGGAGGQYQQAGRPYSRGGSSAGGQNSPASPYPPQHSPLLPGTNHFGQHAQQQQQQRYNDYAQQYPQPPALNRSHGSQGSGMGHSQGSAGGRQ